MDTLQATLIFFVATGSEKEPKGCLGCLATSILAGCKGHK